MNIKESNQVALYKGETVDLESQWMISLEVFFYNNFLK